jgi:hypothetical protein
MAITTVVRPIASIRADPSRPAATTELVEAAHALSRFMAPLVAAIDAGGSPEIVRVFGPRLSEREVDAGTLYGDRLIKRGGGGLETLGGTPLVKTSNLTPFGFFYLPTYIDPETGDLYQGLIVGGFRLHGPLTPPPEARIPPTLTGAEQDLFMREFRAALAAAVPNPFALPGGDHFQL